MNRDSESRLIAFCVEQRGRFDAAAWSRFSAVTPLELAAAMRYLAGVEWYGHAATLRGLANNLTPESFAELVRRTGFDAGRFGNLLKAHLRHAGRPVAA